MPKHEVKHVYVCDGCNHVYDTYGAAEKCEKEHQIRNRAILTITYGDLLNAGVSNPDLVNVAALKKSILQLSIGNILAGLKGKSKHRYYPGMPHICREVLFDKRDHTCPVCEHDRWESEKLNTPA